MPTVLVKINENWERRPFHILITILCKTAHVMTFQYKNRDNSKYNVLSYK